jgi:hypothetical protein
LSDVHRAPRRVHRARVLVFVLSNLVPASAFGQSGALPAAHWGMTTYPESRVSQHMGLQHFLFTEFGKPGDGRYGDLGEMPTMGLTFLTLSNTRVLRRKEDVSSNVLFTSTFQIGRSGDQPGRFLQNQVEHNLDELAFVPRGEVRRATDVGYAGEVSYHFLRSAISRTGQPVARRTPVFIAAGFGVSTLYTEGYTSLGIRDLIGPYFLKNLTRDFFYLSLSSMVRLGIPVDQCLRDCAFENPAPFYLLGQITGTLHLLEPWYPIRFEWGITGHSGLFVDHLRDPMPERFYTARLGLGDLVFELSNDSYGDKDVGPTVALRLLFNITPGTPFLGNLINLL